MNAVQAFQFTYKKTNTGEKKKHFNSGTYLIFKETLWNLYYYPIDKNIRFKVFKGFTMGLSARGQ